MKHGELADDAAKLSEVSGKIPESFINSLNNSAKEALSILYTMDALRVIKQMGRIRDLLPEDTFKQQFHNLIKGMEEYYESLNKISP